MPSVARELGELTTRVAALCHALEQARADEARRYEDMRATLIEAIADHGKRISALELARAMVIGAGAALAAVWAVVRLVVPFLSRGASS